MRLYIKNWQNKLGRGQKEHGMCVGSSLVALPFVTSHQADSRFCGFLYLKQSDMC